MKTLLAYLRPFARRMSLGFSIKVVGTMVELLLPYILTHILQTVVARESLPAILAWGGVMILCAAAALICNIIANRMAAHVSRCFSEAVRRDLFAATLHLSAAKTDRFTIPSLESRITTDTYHVHNFVGMMQRMGVRAPILLVGGVIITLFMDPKLAMAMIVLLPFIFLTVVLISKKGVPHYTRVQQSVDGMVRIVREDVQGIRVIKALSKNDYENRRYDEANRTLVKCERRAGMIMGIVNPVMTMLMNGGIVLVVALAALFVSDGSSHPETVIAFMQYFTLISTAMMSVGRMFVMYTKCAASARRIAEVLHAEEELPVCDERTYPTVETDSHIAFQNVSFSYIGRKNDLTDISFSLPHGGSLGIIGATGSGKSTLIKLLLRFYDVSRGSIYINGRDLRCIPKDELYGMMGTAMQQDFLYADTVAENIRFGRDLTQEQIEEAARIAQAHEFIMTKPDGYGYRLAQKGANLSGGQKQRLLIARALAADPAILLLDDSSSALDYKTDAALRQALSAKRPHTTKITVAQRVSSVMSCDLILVLEEGRIIGAGKHAALLETCQAYKEISDSQIGGAFLNKGHMPRAGGAPEKLDRQRTKHVLKRMSIYVLAYWPLFLLAIALTLLSNQLSLMGPLYSGEAIDAIAAAGGVDFDTAWASILRMLICYIASALLSYLLSILMIHLSQKIVYRMRRHFFEKLNTLPVGYFDTHATGDIISHISYDIDVINASLSHDLVQVMTSLYTVIGSLIFMWGISPPLIAVFALTVPASILFTRYRSKKVRPLYHRRSQKLGELNGYAEEMLSGCRTIQAYGREAEIGARFDTRNEEAMEAYYRAEYYGATLGPSVNFINNLSISLVTIFGGILYMLSQSGVAKAGSLLFISLGGVAQFVQYSRKFAGPINEFANILHEFQSSFAAAERVFRVIDEAPEPPDADGAAALQDVRGEVSLQNVSFGYTPEKTILQGVSVEAHAGQTVAIVGPTGAGKTTVINLLMRFYDISDGAIYIDKNGIAEVTRASLRGAYTMVLQDTWLFHGSIFENIAYGKEGATLEEVKAAARAAHIDSYIEHLPDGYDTVLSDDGVNISKGQRQLITIARAMLSDTRMLILDEATSNVDSRTEIKIQTAMAALMRGRTAFVIAHRLSTIRNADKILVLQDGRITEQGTHNELMARGGFYATLYGAQFT